MPTENFSSSNAADVLADVVRARRTSMVVDQTRVVDDITVDSLCELAIWAPNHKRTWPWRFTHLRGEARRRFGEAAATDLALAGTADDVKIAKTRTKYLRTPSVLIVGCAAHEHPTFHEENRDAVSAGIQNLLLGATARGLASFWSTAPMMSGAHSLEVCGFAPDDRIIAVIYLGYATSDPPRDVERPPATVRHLDA